MTTKCDYDVDSDVIRLCSEQTCLISVGAALVAQESAASAVRSQRTLRRRLQQIQEDYHKLIGMDKFYFDRGRRDFVL